MRYHVYKNTRLYRRVYVDTFTTPDDASVYADMQNRVLGDLSYFYVVEEVNNL